MKRITSGDDVWIPRVKKGVVVRGHVLWRNDGKAQVRYRDEDDDGRQYTIVVPMYSLRALTYDEIWSSLREKPAKVKK